MSQDQKVGIIVLNYNGKACLSACLRSLDQLVYANQEVIVVDNGSTDGSFLRAERHFPRFVFVRNGKNEGFAKGMNVGMRLALARGAQWCLLFNYDAEIAPQALSSLIAAARRHPRAGLLSPVIYKKGSEQIWFAQGRVEFLRMRATHRGLPRAAFASDAYRSEFLTGCALLIKKNLIDTIGFLDERFFLYYEDADYSLRAARAGFDCLVVPQAMVWHSEASRKNPSKTYHLVYSGLLFFEKHTPPLLRPYMALYGTIRRVKNALDRILGRGGAAEEVHRAYEHFSHEH
ncbi:MAG: glycosyltransferase family 2 protein [Candidatus Moraniibacteriota bacterium]